MPNLDDLIAEAREHTERPGPPNSEKCGGCRDLGPHRNVPGCQYYEAPVLPSSGVDEEKLAEVIARVSHRAIGTGTNPRIECVDSAEVARAVAEWLKGQGGERRG